MSQDAIEAGPVTATDVREARFPLIRRGGYDPAQVDPFLELVARTLDGGPEADPRLNSDYIHGVRFTTVRRGGYLPTQVDLFLDRVIATFAEMPQPIGAPPQVSEAPAPVPAAAGPMHGDSVPHPTLASPEPPVSTPPAPAAPLTTARPAPEPAAADTTPEADFDRLRALHRSGVLSDKEFAVLGARVKRRINASGSTAGVGA